MFGGSGKRAFTRTEIPALERALSGAILATLAGVGLLVYGLGRSYDPALFRLDVAQLAQAPTARAEPAQQGADAAAPEPTARPGLESTAATSLLGQLAPDGWQPMGQLERFDADDLYEKIDGRAEQYLAYDVVGLQCRSWAGPDGSYIDVFVYDMGRPLNAFGIYSVERAPQREPEDVGREGYRVASSIFFWQGTAYVQVLASDQTPELTQAARQLAETLADRIPRTREALWGAAALPSAGRVPGTLQFYLRDALSLDFLGNTFTATYRQGEQEITAFVAQHESAAAAAATLDAYAAYLGSYGQVVQRDTVADGGWLVGDMAGMYDAVFARGAMVGGVTMAADRNAAETVARSLLTHLGGE